MGGGRTGAGGGGPGYIYGNNESGGRDLPDRPDGGGVIWNWGGGGQSGGGGLGGGGGPGYIFGDNECGGRGRPRLPDGGGIIWNWGGGHGAGHGGGDPGYIYGDGESGHGRNPGDHGRDIRYGLGGSSGGGEGGPDTAGTDGSNDDLNGNGQFDTPGPSVPDLSDWLERQQARHGGTAWAGPELVNLDGTPRQQYVSQALPQPDWPDGRPLGGEPVSLNLAVSVHAID